MHEFGDSPLKEALESEQPVHNYDSYPVQSVQSLWHWVHSKGFVCEVK